MAAAKQAKPLLTHLTLHNGDKMPSVGFGFWKIAKDVCAETAYNAIKSGYRCIDEACDYGNEKECGEGIKKAIDEGLVKREDLFITSKLWNTYHRKEHVEAACKRSLADLGVDQLDLYLIHFPISLKFVPFEKTYPPDWIYDTTAENPKMEEDLVPIQETWKAMEKLVKDGLVKNIGVCNMVTGHIRDMLSYAEIKPSVLQVEIHPYLSQNKLLRFCKERGIAVTGFSSFGGSAYTEIGMAKEVDCIMNDAVVQKIAGEVGKSAAQVALRWAIQRGYAVIPKTIKPKRMVENISLFDFELNEEQMTTISALNKNRRFNDPGVFAEKAFNTFYPIYD